MVTVLIVSLLLGLCVAVVSANWTRPLLSGYKLNRFSWLLDSNNSDWELVL
jgi:hypothetical protein